MPIGIHLKLHDANGSALTNQTNLQCLWWDVAEPKNVTLRPTGKTSVGTTDGSGFLDLDLSNVTGLSTGDFGFLLVYKLDGSDHKDSPTFSGKVATETISSGVDMYYYKSGWTRPSGWITLTAPGTSDQKFVGVHQVYEESNFIALSAEGAYYIDWGNGGGNNATASGVTAQRNLVYSEYAGNTDAGIEFAEAVTFTDSGDTVNLTAHTYKNGEKVAFSSITSTTGISTYTNYFVVNAAANTFQVATTIGGTALTLTTDGSGNAYRPMWRQALITLTMQAGNNLTKLNLQVRHSQSGLPGYSSGFVDIALAGQYLTDFRLGAVNPASVGYTILHDELRKLNVVRSDLKQCGYIAYYLSNLREVTAFATSTDAAFSSAVTFQDSGDTVTHTSHGRRNGDPVMFTSITSTTGIQTNRNYFIINAATNTYQVATTPSSGSAIALTTDGSGVALYGTHFKGMFYNCYSLQSVPLFNTAAGTDMSNMFDGCSTLQSVPLFNTAENRIFSQMFQSCVALRSVPLFDTSAGTTFSSMFYFCHSLQSVPLFDTSAAWNFSGMVSYCEALLSAPLFDTSAGTSFSSMFQGCYSLQTVPSLNTAGGTSFSQMFSNCYSLQTVPSLNTAAGVNFSSMFANCYALEYVPLFNTAAGTNFTSMFQSCYALTSVPLFNMAAGTTLTAMFTNCYSLANGRLAGTAQDISYADCKLSSAALNDIYTGLGTVTSKTITVTSNWGTSGDDPTIATAKGWTVTG